ncbi:glucosamine-6-phosphate deaminase [Rhizosphaericola mali]|uniref:Glucosamine-6-phosphate deaminase n=1 Tax=Rhizosphaericola mali TaxID=2545455 RepID=A0A5P2G1P6_9BACT|nr:glucosamine-6-phosphate deaminase [Rhizosphaericola mali]QES89724.1 glucosamine-6-phosphate deaminase [Rhizosphaericola mali]
MNLVDSFEKIPVEIFATPKDGAKHVAETIASLIKEKSATGQNCVLGLATGSTPIYIYDELVRLHKEEGLSFKNVITFNLDEYFPIEKSATQSYWYFMHHHLFDHVDIAPENIHIPDGSLPKEKVKEFCANYEKQIEEAGGIDLQILGIGDNGHIGFNEPGSSFNSKTRLQVLENKTRIANSREFQNNITLVPRLSITMGIGTIMRSKKVVLVAWSNKAPIIVKAVEGPVTEQVPASILQQHPNASFVIDEPGASELTRFKSPWLTGEIEWTPKTVKKAVINMALKLKKPILSLSANDYNENGLGDLLAEKGDAYQINLQVFYELRDSITGWPAGKPNVSLPNHPERSNPYPKRVLLFSPHPDDDVISMGGTFERLQEQGNDVHVAYQTSGNIAVTDEFVGRYLDFAVGFDKLIGRSSDKTEELKNDANSFLSNKEKDGKDSEFIRQTKGLIRRCEAKAAAMNVGLKEDHIHFNNLPFYESGTIEKLPMSQADVDITKKLLREVKPHQVYAAGDWADPHGTHKVCFNVLMEALQQIKADGDEWIKECWLWLYKGAWQEWDMSDIEMAIPMSPDQVMSKRYNIYFHQSQKDMVPFAGTDAREFWQRAEERNANTANLYSQLGLTKYAAIEAFVKWPF